MQAVKFMSLRNVEKRNGCSWYDKKINLINILILLIALKYSESSLLFGFFAIVQH